MNNSKKAIILLLFIFLLIAIFASLFIGRYPLPVSAVWKVLLSELTGGARGEPDIAKTLILDIRLPRVVLGAMVGGCLAISGAAFQGLFRNPLVSSDMLGVSHGAGFGAAMAIILFHGNITAIYVFAFSFGLLAVFFSYLIGRVYNTTPSIMLVLGGIIVSSIFSALISFAKYVADPYQQLPTIVFWLMGSLAAASYRNVLIAGVPMIVGVTGLICIRWRVNVLSMGDKEAHALGINPAVDRGIVIVCATLATAGAVCVSGIIGWVGLIIPHIARMLVGDDNGILIPASYLAGAVFLVLVDDLSRIITGSEMPLGILTALLGAPFFIYLLKKTKAKGW